MKRKLLFLLLLLTAFNAQSQDFPQQKVDSKIEKVTVFLNGAQVQRSASVTLPVGKSEIILRGLTPNLEQQSVVVKGDGDFTIVSVKPQMNFLEEVKRKDTIALLEQERERIYELTATDSIEIVLLLNEESILLKNQVQVIGLQYNTGKTEDLLSLLDVQKKNLKILHERKLELQRAANKRNKEVYRITALLVELKAYKSTPTAEVLVTVFVKKGPSVKSAKLTLDYLVPNTNWYPTYDLRVKDVASPMQAQMKAKVRQNSGEDWREVKLTLSTGEPKRTGVKPELGTWQLREGGYGLFIGQKINEIEDFTKLRLANQSNKINGRVRDAKTGEALVGCSVVIKGTMRGAVTDVDGNFSLEILPTDKILVVSYIGFVSQETAIGTGNFVDVRLNEDKNTLSEVVVTGYSSPGNEDRDFKPAAPKRKIIPNTAGNPLVVKVNEQATTTAFEIELPYSIPSNGKEYQVDIKEENLAAKYQYAVAPKLDNDAFLTAYLTDWEQYNLIEGEASLYFEGMYLGKTLLKTNSTDDTLKISLGRDKNVVVKRTKLKEYNKNKVFSNKKVETRAFEIVVKNKKSTPLSILIEEQIPVSTDKQIEVDTDADGAILDKVKGRLTWKLDLKPSEERKLKFSYTVKHPEDWHVDLE
jgi:hypothetical protein